MEKAYLNNEYKYKKKSDNDFKFYNENGVDYMLILNLKSNKNQM